MPLRIALGSNCTDERLMTVMFLYFAKPEEKTREKFTERVNRSQKRLEEELRSIYGHEEMYSELHHGYLSAQHLDGEGRPLNRISTLAAVLREILMLEGNVFRIFRNGGMEGKYGQGQGAEEMEGDGPSGNTEEEDEEKEAKENRKREEDGKLREKMEVLRGRLLQRKKRLKGLMPQKEEQMVKVS